MEKYDNDKNRKIPIWQKYTMTIKEASDYFGIGEKKLRRLIDDHPDQAFSVTNGVKVLIKRRAFETFLDSVSAI